MKFDQNGKAEVVGFYENLKKQLTERILAYQMQKVNEAANSETIKLGEEYKLEEEDIKNVKFSRNHLVTLEGELILIAAILDSR